MHLVVRLHLLVKPEAADAAIDRDAQTGPQFAVLAQPIAHTWEQLVEFRDHAADVSRLDFDGFNTARERLQLRGHINDRPEDFSERQFESVSLPEAMTWDHSNPDQKQAARQSRQTEPAR